MLAVGDTVQGLEVVRVLHEGSMAVTYEVKRPPDRCRYALKLLFMRDPEFQERLRRTGQAQRTFVHPNIVAVVDTVEIDGAPGVVSLYMEGTPLSEWIEQGPHSVADVLGVAHGIASGLAAAHQRGLIHRNLKPQKVIIDRVGVPHIHDFMLGKVVGTGPSNAMTQMGMTFGTPQYMSPEQFRGAATVDPRADLFSLGCLVHEMATGERAFDGVSLMDIYQAVMDGTRRPVHEVRNDLPEVLDRFVAWLLATDPDDRPSSAREVVDALDHDAELRWARGLPDVAPPMGRPGPLAGPASGGGGATITPAHDPVGPTSHPELVGVGPPSGGAAAGEGPPARPRPPTPAPLDVRPADDAPSAPAVPPPPPMVTPETQPVWMSLLGLLVVAGVLGGLVAAVVMSGR